MDKKEIELMKDNLKAHDKNSSTLEHHSKASLINVYMDLLKLSKNMMEELDK